MAEWLTVVPALFVTLLLLWVPGTLIGIALRLRGYLIVGVAPAITIAILAASAVAAPYAGIDYSSAVWGSAVLLVLVLAIAVGFLTRPARHGSSPRRIVLERLTHIGVAASIAFSGVALQMRRTMRSIGDPERISQTYDANYHLNAVMLMQETRNASSLHMTLATPGREQSFYPAAWHDVVLTITDLTGLSVPAATNVLAVVVAGVVWPVAVAVLARSLFGPRPLPVAFAALLSTAFPQMPNHLVSFGVLYPNLLSYALVPVAVALVVELLSARGERRTVYALTLGGVLVAVTLAQPNGLFLLAFVAVPACLARLLAWSRTVSSRSMRPRVVGAWGAVIGVLLIVWFSLDRVGPIASLRAGTYWVADKTARQALWDVLSLSTGHPNGEPQILLAVAVLAGMVIALRTPRWRWVALSYLVLGALCILTLAGGEPHRSDWTGFWYADPNRLAATLPLLGVPLAALASWRGWQALERQLRRWRGRSVSDVARRIGTVGVAISLGAAAVLIHSWQTPTRLSFADMQEVYGPDPTSVGSDELLSAEEYELLDMLDELVPEQVVVAGNPWDGSAMSWAVGGREALFPHPGMSLDADRAIVAERLHEAEQDPAVCQAVRDLDLGYVLRMGTPLWGHGVDDRAYHYRGIALAEAAGVAEPVTEVGSARLLEITACGPVD